MRKAKENEGSNLIISENLLEIYSEIILDTTYKK